MRRVHCLNLLTLRWAEKTVAGECPCDLNARRNVDCFLDGDRLLVLGESVTMSDSCFSEHRLCRAVVAPCSTPCPEN